MKDFQKVNTREKVAEMHARGLRPFEIAKILDISRQRVHQHLSVLGLGNDSKTSEKPTETLSEASGGSK